MLWRCRPVSEVGLRPVGAMSRHAWRQARESTAEQGNRADHCNVAAPAQAPIALDCCQGHILLAFNSLRLLMLRADVHGEVRPSGRPSATLVSIRELSLLSVAQPVSAIALIANGRAPLSEGVLSQIMPALEVGGAAGSGGTEDASHARNLGSPKNGVFRGELGNWRAVAPTHCVLIRWGGLLSLLDLDSGTETHLMEVCAQLLHVHANYHWFVRTACWGHEPSRSRLVP